MGLAVLFVMIPLAIVAFIVLYNRFITLRNLADEGFSGIDVQLKRRHDVVTQLVSVVKGAADFEKGLLDSLVKARANAMEAKGLAGREAAELGLSGALGKFMAVAEAYPDLKASKNFLQLQEQIAHLEEELSMARRYYNACVRDHNTYGQTLPANLLAGLAHFSPRPYFMAEDSDKAVPGMAF